MDEFSENFRTAFDTFWQIQPSLTEDQTSSFLFHFPPTEDQILFAARETNWANFLPSFLPTDEQMLSISLKIPFKALQDTQMGSFIYPMWSKLKDTFAREVQIITN